MDIHLYEYAFLPIISFAFIFPNRKDEVDKNKSNLLRVQNPKHSQKSEKANDAKKREEHATKNSFMVT